LRAGREADLVVDDEMDAAAGVVATDAGEAEALPHDALTRKCRVAMDQNRQHLFVLGQIVAVGLLRADLAQHDGIDRFKMAGVGDQRHMDVNAVKLAVGAGAQMIFDVARTADILRVGGAARKFVEDNAERLCHHIGEHVQATAMRHAVHDFAHAILAAIFDDRFHRRDHRFAAVQPEPLGPDVLLAEEFLPLLGLDHLGQDRLLAVGRELDRLVLALDAFLQEAALLHIGDVHVLKADIAAVIAAQDRHDFAHAGLFQAQIAAQKYRTVHIGFGKAMIFRRQVGGQILLRQAQRIEIGGQMPAHAIGADEQHRADRIVGSARDIGAGRRRGRGGCRAATRGLGRRLHLGRIERSSQRVGILERPAGVRPAWSRHAALQPVEPLAPARLDRRRIGLELRI